MKETYNKFIIRRNDKNPQLYDVIEKFGTKEARRFPALEFDVASNTCDTLNIGYFDSLKGK